MGGKEKFKRHGVFSLRNFVFLSIIVTCIVVLGKFSQEIFLTVQNPQYIEVTREYSYVVVVTATPNPSWTSCTRDALLYAIRIGGEVVFDCNNVILIDAPIVISNRVHLKGSSELLTTLSQSQDMASLFIIESGGSLTLENISIRDIHGTVLIVHQGGSFSGRNCRIIGSGRGDIALSLIRNEGWLSLSQCVLENNQIASGTLLWMGNQSNSRIGSTVFRANTLSSGDFTGEGSLIENTGGVLNIDSSYFLDNVGNNAQNWVIRSRSGETNIGRSLFRNNQFSMQGYMVENGADSMMYMDAVSMVSNTIFRGEYITNAGNLRILNGAAFNGTCANTGILTDIARQCG